MRRLSCSPLRLRFGRGSRSCCGRGSARIRFRNYTTIIRFRPARHFVMDYIWVDLQLSVAKSLIFPRGDGQTRQIAPCLRLGMSKDMTKVLQFEQPSSTVRISGIGESHK